MKYHLWSRAIFQYIASSENLFAYDYVSKMASSSFYFKHVKRTSRQTWLKFYNKWMDRSSFCQNTFSKWDYLNFPVCFIMYFSLLLFWMLCLHVCSKINSFRVKRWHMFCWNVFKKSPMSGGILYCFLRPKWKVHWIYFWLIKYLWRSPLLWNKLYQQMRSTWPKAQINLCWFAL